MFGIFWKFKLAKFFFLEAMFFKSKDIFFFNNLGKIFNLLTGILFFDFLEIISIWSNDISLLPFKGKAFFFLLKALTFYHSRNYTL